MHKVRVYVTLRESILDPAGTAVKGSLNRQGFQEVENVRIGKYIELTVDKVDEARIKDMCEKLLANTVMEDYRIEVEESGR